MSISRMVDLGIKRQHELSAPAATAANAVVPPPASIKDQAKEAFSNLTAFVPSEVVALYVAWLGLWSPQTDTAKWLAFFVCLFLIPVFMFVNYLIQKQSADSAKTKVWIILFIFAVVAFVVWAAAMPATPFLYFGEKVPTVAGFVVPILAALMTKIAKALGVVPKAG
jgi:hypothetical protein